MLKISQKQRLTNLPRAFHRRGTRATIRRFARPTRRSPPPLQNHLHLPLSPPSRYPPDPSSPQGPPKATPIAAPTSHVPPSLRLRCLIYSTPHTPLGRSNPPKTPTTINMYLHAFSFSPLIYPPTSFQLKSRSQRVLLGRAFSDKLGGGGSEFPPLGYPVPKKNSRKLPSQLAPLGYPGGRKKSENSTKSTFTVGVPCSKQKTRETPPSRFHRWGTRARPSKKEKRPSPTRPFTAGVPGRSPAADNKLARRRSHRLVAPAVDDRYSLVPLKYIYSGVDPPIQARGRKLEKI